MGSAGNHQGPQKDGEMQGIRIKAGRSIQSPHTFFCFHLTIRVLVCKEATGIFVGPRDSHLIRGEARANENTPNFLSIFKLTFS